MGNERPTIPVPYHQSNQDENSDLFEAVEGAVERYLRSKAAKGRYLSVSKKQRLIRTLVDKVLGVKLTASTKAQRVKVLKAVSKVYTFKELARELSKGTPLAVTQAMQMLIGEGFLVEKEYSPNDQIELTQKGRVATNEFIAPARGRAKGKTIGAKERVKPLKVIKPLKITPEPDDVMLMRELEKMKKEAPKDALWSVRQWKKRCLEANRAMTSEEFDAAANRLQRTGRITLHQTENPLDRFDESLVKGGPDRQGLPTRYIGVA